MSEVGSRNVTVEEKKPQSSSARLSELEQSSLRKQEPLMKTCQVNQGHQTIDVWQKQQLQLAETTPMNQTLDYRNFNQSVRLSRPRRQLKPLPKLSQQSNIARVYMAKQHSTLKLNLPVKARRISQLKRHKSPQLPSPKAKVLPKKEPLVINLEFKGDEKSRQNMTVQNVDSPRIPEHASDHIQISTRQQTAESKQSPANRVDDEVVFTGAEIVNIRSPRKDQTDPLAQEMNSFVDTQIAATSQEMGDYRGSRKRKKLKQRSIQRLDQIPYGNDQLVSRQNQQDSLFESKTKSRYDSLGEVKKIKNHNSRVLQSLENRFQILQRNERRVLASIDRHRERAETVQQAKDRRNYERMQSNRALAIRQSYQEQQRLSNFKQKESQRLNLSLVHQSLMLQKKLQHLQVRKESSMRMREVESNRSRENSARKERSSSRKKQRQLALSQKLTHLSQQEVKRKTQHVQSVIQELRTSQIQEKVINSLSNIELLMSQKLHNSKQKLRMIETSNPGEVLQLVKRNSSSRSILNKSERKRQGIYKIQNVRPFAAVDNSFEKPLPFISREVQTPTATDQWGMTKPRKQHRYVTMQHTKRDSSPPRSRSRQSHKRRKSQSRRSSSAISRQSDSQTRQKKQIGSEFEQKQSRQLKPKKMQTRFAKLKQEFEKLSQEENVAKRNSKTQGVSLEQKVEWTGTSQAEDREALDRNTSLNN